MTSQTLTLTEYRPLRLPREALDEALATRLWREYDAGRGVLRVGFPSPRSEGQWELTSRGWVGHIPLDRQLALLLQPRVSVSNLFRMLEVAYDLGSFHFLDGLTGTESLRDLYRRLAVALARGVLARSQQGFYRAYVGRQERLPYLRGRVDVRQGVRQPAQPAIACRYQEATGDVLHNQILAWTLHTLACSGICDDDGTSYGDGAQALMRRAYRRLDGVTSLRPLPASACDHVTYQRLNDDYRPLHALCRFFLEQAGPAHHAGDHEMLPFLLNMARLFERFVAQWLRAHLPAPWSLSVQEQVPLGEPSNTMAFYPDLVLYDGEGQARVVLDTKYRTIDDGRRTMAIPDTADVAQVLAYAQSKECTEAVLVYPHVPATPFEADVGGVRVWALSFALDGDLEKAGVALQNAILQL